MELNDRWLPKKEVGRRELIKGMGNREESGSLRSLIEVHITWIYWKISNSHAFKETGGLRRRHVTPGISYLPFPNTEKHKHTPNAVLII